MSNLYEWTIDKKIVLDKPEKVKDDKGVEIEIKEKSAPVKFYLRKPNRLVREEASTYYASLLRYYIIEKKCMSVSELRQRLTADESNLNKKDRDELKKLYDDWSEKEIKLQRLQTIPEKDKTQDNQKEIIELTAELVQIQTKVQAMEQSLANLFNSTAEAYSKSRTILFYLVNMSYWEQDSKQVLFFGDGTLDNKLDKLEEIAENNDPFLVKAKDEFLLYTSIWFEGGADKKEHFDEIKRRMNKPAEPDKTETDKKEETKTEVKTDEAKKEGHTNS